MALEFAPASKKFHLKAFDCGIKELNDYLRFYVVKNYKNQISRAFIAYDSENPSSVLGYYTVSSAQISFDEYPEDLKNRLPKYPIPAMRIGKLASSTSVRGKGIGAALLRDAFLRAVAASEQVAIHCIIVDALNQQAASFYAQYGFASLTRNPPAMVLPMNTAREAYRESSDHDSSSEERPQPLFE